MSNYHIDSVRWPDEFRFVLRSVSENFGKHAKPDGEGVLLTGLSTVQNLAMSLFHVISEVDEVIVNLNMVTADLGRLGKSAKAFGDANPFTRYKFLMRMWLYEFARFEDLFGYYTLFLEKNKLLTKQERKQAREEFYKANEPFIRMRNVFAHDAATWEGHVTTEIGLLAAADQVRMAIKDKDGKLLTWDDHIAPLCARMLPNLFEAGREMRITWSMLMAHLALQLVESGVLEKARRPFEPGPEFLHPGRPDR
jgi:hypothetical protein